MKHEEILEKLQGIFQEQFDDDEIVVTDDTCASDIEDWDSLAHMELLATIEETFNIHFSLGEVNSFANVGELVDCVLKHVKQ